MVRIKFKKIAPVLALLLVFSLALTACASKPESIEAPPTQTTPSDNPPASSPPAGEPSGEPAGELKAYKIGVNTWGSGVPILDLFGDEAEYALKAFGLTTTRASDDFTAEKEVQNVQNFIGAGVDGIALQGAAVSTVPQIGAECLKAGVPFVMHVFIGDDADRAKLQTDNPFYVGAIDADMVLDGEIMAQSALRDGCKTAVLIGGNIGDNNMDQRSEGFRRAFEAGGGTILDEARCTDNSECLTKAQDMLSANRDVDCLYAMVGDYIPGSLSAIENLGLEGSIKVYMSCVDELSANYIKEGKIVEGNDGICLSSSLAPTLLLNYLDGHQILDDSGKAPHLRTIPFIVNKDNADAYMSIFCSPGINPIPETILKSLCWRFNPDVTYQTYVDLITNGLNLNALLSAHGK